jgi:hypothetical protein
MRGEDETQVKKNAKMVSTVDAPLNTSRKLGFFLRIKEILVNMFEQVKFYEKQC